eukprot:Hpha_TRINITY_DN16773_c0_g2::TRINITY_DN16773_c0_g2_i1::g.78259::m.78259
MRAARVVLPGRPAAACRRWCNVPAPISSPPPMLSVGGQVEGLVEGRWKPGLLAGVHRDGTRTVRLTSCTGNVRLRRLHVRRPQPPPAWELCVLPLRQRAMLENRDGMAVQLRRGEGEVVREAEVGKDVPSTELRKALGSLLTQAGVSNCYSAAVIPHSDADGGASPGYLGGGDHLCTLHPEMSVEEWHRMVWGAQDVVLAVPDLTEDSRVAAVTVRCLEEEQRVTKERALLETYSPLLLVGFALYSIWRYPVLLGLVVVLPLIG